jgi:hypothetical protein
MTKDNRNRKIEDDIFRSIRSALDSKKEIKGNPLRRPSRFTLASCPASVSGVELGHGSPCAYIRRPNSEAQKQSAKTKKPLPALCGPRYIICR